MNWKSDWTQAKRNLSRWWQGEGLVVSMSDARRQTPIEDIPCPTSPALLLDRWTDPGYRCAQAEYDMARRLYPAETFPYFDTQIGPGSLSLAKLLYRESRHTARFTRRGATL